MNFPKSALAIGMLQALYGGVARAATINVDSTLDGFAAGVCTLRSAMYAARTDSAGYGTCPAGSGNDTITFNGLGGQTINLVSGVDPSNGEFRVNTTIDIDASAEAMPVSIETVNNDPTFYIQTSGTTGNLTLRNIDLYGGTSGPSIINASSNGAVLTLENVTIRDRTGPLTRGALYLRNATTTTISNSTISNVSGGSFGCAIHARADLTITNSTFANNLCGGYPAISFGGNLGTVTITNSTITNNRNTVLGDTGPANMERYNTAIGTLNLINTVVSDPLRTLFSGTPTTGTNCGVSTSYPAPFTVQTNTNSHIDDTSCGTADSGAAGLGSLGDYGGLTQTVEVLPGSALRDAGDAGTCAGITFDQRGTGFPRSVDGGGGAICDIGAFEAQTVPVELQTFEIE